MQETFWHSQSYLYRAIFSARLLTHIVPKQIDPDRSLPVTAAFAFEQSLPAVPRFAGFTDLCWGLDGGFVILNVRVCSGTSLPKYIYC